MTSYSCLYQMLEHFVQPSGGSHTLSVPCGVSPSAKAASRHVRAEPHKLPAGLGFCSPLPEVCSMTLSQLFSLAALSQFSGCKLGKIILLACSISSTCSASSSPPGLYAGLLPCFQQGCRPRMPQLIPTHKGPVWGRSQTVAEITLFSPLSPFFCLPPFSSTLHLIHSTFSLPLRCRPCGDAPR